MINYYFNGYYYLIIITCQHLIFIFVCVPPMVEAGIRGVCATSIIISFKNKMKK